MKRNFSNQTPNIYPPEQDGSSNLTMKRLFRKTRKSLNDGFSLKFSIAGSPLTLLLTVLPVFIMGCARAETLPETTERPMDATSEIKFKLNIAQLPTISVQSLDILFFNNDRHMRLDSWQHIDGPIPNHVNAASRNGSKIAAVIANGPSSLAEHISSYDSLSSVLCHLEDEDVQNPVMKGERSVETQDESFVELEMTPFMSQIVIESISCDFYGKTYEGQKLEDVRIYLTNVRTEWPLSGNTETFYPSGFANQGGLDTNLLDNLKDKIVAEISGSIGMRVIYPDIHLWCYPDGIKEESAGQPFTRLVIEGTLAGEKTYYPIDVNRGKYLPGGGSTGVGQSGNFSGPAANGKYVYNITLTQRGTDSPETLAESNVMQVKVRAAAWTGKDNQVIRY